MARFQILIVCLVVANHIDHSLSEEQDYNNVMSYEVVGTGSHSSSITDGKESKQNTGLYEIRRQRRSPHIGSFGGHYQRPVYVQPIGVAPVQPVYGHYQTYPLNNYHNPHTQTQQLSNSHSQSQSVSASFGGNPYLGTGGSAISAAAASAGSGNNQLVHHGYRRK